MPQLTLKWAESQRQPLHQYGGPLCASREILPVLKVAHTARLVIQAINMRSGLCLAWATNTHTAALSMLAQLRLLISNEPAGQGTATACEADLVAQRLFSISAVQTLPTVVQAVSRRNRGTWNICIWPEHLAPQNCLILLQVASKQAKCCVCL